jgi:hypothetical protein
MINTMKKLVMVLAAILLAGCASSAGESKAPQGKVTIHNGVWAGYQQYLIAISPNKPGAFAVSVDGNNAFYQICEGIRCRPGISFRTKALQGCERYGQPCYIFAYRNDILVDYEVR